MERIAASLRLGDLSVQTSSYGTPLPRIYGTMRVAGTVVWATDLLEHEASEGGGKSGPDVVTYNYTVSLAVALSSRQARQVKRIWADGKLLRGKRGDLKVPGKLRFYPGGEDQAVDPLIAGIEGIGKTPAYRGLALAVFEDLALADYGNRIPVLTFELTADDGSVEVADVIADVSRGAIVATEGTTPLKGFAAHGRDRRGAIEDLVDLFAIELADDGERLRVVTGEAPVVVGAKATRGCAAKGDRSQGQEERSQLPARSLPASLTLNYYEESRDYQAGQARALIAGGGRTEWRVDSPVVLTAASAKSIANQAMARRWATRDRMKLRLPPRFSAVGPGGTVAIEDVAGLWSVAAATIDGGVVVLDLQRQAAGGHPSEADAGRPVAETDEPIGMTDIALFDLPDLGLASRDRLVLWAAASADGAFRSVPASVDCNGQPLAAISLGRRAVLGRCATMLGQGATNIFDMMGAVEVRLTDPSQILLNADDDALAIGANLALLGDELLQFGHAEVLGAGHYRLSRLLRGRRGTEWAMGFHADGERFLLIDRATLAAVALADGMRGATVSVTAHGIADDPLDPPAATCLAAGEALRPLGPVALTAAIGTAGDMRVGWIERSRDAYGWVDGTGGVAEAGRRFRITVDDGTQTLSTETAQTAVMIPAADLADLAASLTVSVETLGALGASRTITVQLDR